MVTQCKAMGVRPTAGRADFALGGAALLTLAACVVPAPAAAQMVRGAVVDSVTHAPLADVTVVLLDSAGSRAAATLASGRGRFVLRAPGPGRYQLRVQRIGYQSTMSALFAARRGDTLDQRVVGPGVPVALPVVVQDRRRCDIQPAEGSDAATLWEEVRKALEATALTEDQGRLRVKLVEYARELDRSATHVRWQRHSERSGSVQTPYASPPPDELSTHGYVRVQGDTTWYYAPDARIVLSNRFLARHCLRAERGDTGRAAAAGLVGLAFEPIQEEERNRIDIRGVLWMDERTAELRYLEYRYTSLPPALAADSLGGRVDFQRVPGSGWIIRRWVVRAPIGREAEWRYGTVLRAEHSGSPRFSPDAAQVLVGIREEGGEIVEAWSPGGDHLFAGGSGAGRAGVETSRGEVVASPAASSRPSDRCAVIRSSRQHGIDSALAIPAARWTPPAGDPVSSSKLDRAAAVLQFVVDTLGRPEMETVRAVGAHEGVYEDVARQRLMALHFDPSEPLPGCRARRLMVVAFHIRAAP